MNAIKQKAGGLGGLATFQKYGREHMATIGKRGYQVTTSRYELKPVKLSQWCLVHRETGKIEAIW